MNLALETGHIEYIAGTLKGSDVIHKIRQLGYSAQIKATEEEIISMREQELERKKWNWILSAILFFPFIMGDGRALFLHFLDLGA